MTNGIPSGHTLRPPSGPMRVIREDPTSYPVWADSLLDQLAELDHLYRMAPVGLCLLDRELRFLRVNQRLAEISGRPVSEHIGCTVRELLPEIAPALEPVLRRVVETGEPVLGVEVHGTTAARPGEERCWLQNCYPLMSADGTVRSISVVVQEITKLKRAEEALREAHDLLERRVEERTRELTEVNVALRAEIAERKKTEAALWRSEERFRRILEAAPDSMILVRDDGTVVLINEQTERLFGYRREELIGQPLAKLIPHYRRQQHGEDCRHYFTDPQPRAMGNGGALSGLCKNGDEVAVEITLSPLETEEGLLVCGSIRDITARKRSEEESRRLREELAHVGRVATMGELGASLAHELFQPLSAISCNAEAARRFLAGDDPDLDEVRDALAGIVADNQRAAEVIRRLRNLLKKGELQQKGLNVNQLVKEVTTLVRGELAGKKISLTLALADDLPRVFGDRIQLQQVLLNLLLNAVEAMSQVPEDGRQLVVETAQQEPGVLTLAVCDSGIGFPEEARERMFEAFFTTRPEGMGMGLSISRTIIQAHGGRLWATRNPDRGATFHFTLPIEPEAAP